MPFRAHSIYFLYLLAHFSFYFQQIYFQTFFHLPSLLLSCCFFCTQVGNLFWKRYFNRSHSEQSFCLLAHLYLKYISSSQGTVREHVMRYLHLQNPQRSGSCNMQTLWNPTVRSQYWCTEEECRGENLNRSNVKIWNKQYLRHDWFGNQKWKLNDLTVFQLRLTTPENTHRFFYNRKAVFFHSHKYWWDPRWKNYLHISTAQETGILACWAKVTSREPD